MKLVPQTDIENTLPFFKRLWVLQIKTSNKFMIGMVAILAAATVALGPVAMFNLYFMPYWAGVIWLDVVTYLHHHGSEDPQEQIPWYRGEVCLSPMAHAQTGCSRRP